MWFNHRCRNYGGGGGARGGGGVGGGGGLGPSVYKVC